MARRLYYQRARAPPTANGWRPIARPAGREAKSSTESRQRRPRAGQATQIAVPTWLVAAKECRHRDQRLCQSRETQDGNPRKDESSGGVGGLEGWNGLKLRQEVFRSLLSIRRLRRGRAKASLALTRWRFLKFEPNDRAAVIDRTTGAPKQDLGARSQSRASSKARGPHSK
jgi:hypothetical protein